MKIFFILSSIHVIHADKRIREFIDNGYDVEVFGFCRDGNYDKESREYSINIIGSFTNEMPYVKRVPIIYKGLKSAISEVQNDDLLYVFGLDVAMFLKIIPHPNYFYEEADLTYTYFSRSILRKVFNMLDKSIIRRSLETVLTSDGFAYYLFGKKIPPNITIIPNRLNPEVELCRAKLSKKIDINHLSFGFVGCARFLSVYNFTKVIAEKFPNHKVMLYGTFTSKLRPLFEDIINNCSNIEYMGVFKNPAGLPEVYESIDISIGTYDVTSDNVKYAEPNKLYEAIYFDVPIIVSKDTFLENRVLSMGIGEGIYAMNEDSVYNFIKHLDVDTITKWKNNCSAINKEECINNNSLFFSKINRILNKKNK